MLYQISSFVSPEPLYDQCLHFVVENWRECLTEKKLSDDSSLEKNLILPSQISEDIFNLYLRRNKAVNEDIFSIFKNPKLTRLKRVNLRKEYSFKYNMKDFLSILHQDLTELRIDNYPETSEIPELAFFNFTKKLLQYLNLNGKNLKVFSCKKEFFSSAFIGKMEELPTDFVPKISDYSPLEISPAFHEWDHVLNAPNLEKLSLTDFTKKTEIFHKLITPLKKLTHLDITNCFSVLDYSFLLQLPSLKSLTLHNVNVSEDGFKKIKKISQLESLDLSCSSGGAGFYTHPQNIAIVIKGLPNLVSLDISGTNLDIDIAEALKWRKNYDLHYLGLYKTYNNACSDNRILAKRISGDSNIKQLFNAGFAHFEREFFMRRLLDDFNQGLKNFIEHDSILKFVFKVLDRHPKLAADCQALFKHVLSLRIPLTIKAKRHLIRTVMNMAIIDNSIIDDELFSKWTANDLFFDVKLLMDFINYLIDKNMEKKWAQEILYHILNTANESQELFLNYDVIKSLTLAITKTQEPYYFEWDFAWRCINNNFDNSKIFLNNFGLDLFVREIDYLMDHSESKEIMERLLIVYFSLSQFESLANEFLIEDNFISKLLEILQRDFPQSPFQPDNGPRVNYYAGCILLKLLSYEQSEIKKEKREDILEKIKINLEKWSPNHIPHCCLEDELLEPILSLLKVEHIPECRYWAVWGIFHFCHDIQQTYFFSNQERMNLLKGILETKSAPHHVKKIAAKLFQIQSS